MFSPQVPTFFGHGNVFSRFHFYFIHIPEFASLFLTFRHKGIINREVDHRKGTYFMKKIVMTGGGTAGHVTPNIALMPALQKEGYEISYIGSYEGIEKRLIEEQGIPYYGISSGKLRRYFDPKNFSDPFFGKIPLYKSVSRTPERCGSAFCILLGKIAVIY